MPPGIPLGPVYVLELAGEDDAFAACEARAAGTGVERVGTGLARAKSISRDRVRGLAFTRRASELLGTTDADLGSARALLEASTLNRKGTVAVRARDLRSSTAVDTQAVEHDLGQVLVDRGYVVDLDDPDHELRALFGTVPADLDRGGNDTQTGPGDDTVCALGWLAAESVRDFGTRTPPDRPFVQPGSMDPLLARALANVAGAAPGRTLVDPMCGTGGVLIEAGLVGARTIGVDAQEKMATGAAENCREHLDHRPNPLGPSGQWSTLQGDATRLPLPDDAAEAVVFDAPYGRQSKIVGDLAELVEGALAEARRIAPRAVMVADRAWPTPAREAGWKVEASFERRVHRSLTRQILVLE
ncbi:MAG: tRNA (guanine10-N2)-dimethyltransferase [Halobacteriales archaeon]|jgi:tRNA (guanine10-N2)-dimethyltransferase